MASRPWLFENGSASIVNEEKINKGEHRSKKATTKLIKKNGHEKEWSTYPYPKQIEVP